MGHLQTLPHILLDQQDRHSFPADFHGRLEDFGHHERGKTERRLVEHEDLRPGHQACGTMATNSCRSPPLRVPAKLAGFLLEDRKEGMDPVLKDASV